ncbi:hypothetical protein HBI56_177290 [Parastagonospora nodorum]|uniref:Uncharacterized protein n=1 Tax=Phaeosphaeria nodorum (strain SN15 / ATCC MYA-4574 / FGSC 10173) TaxID=321614 RepID=A0A7U2ESX1_PHANO|nr:hypothetical protein HBH56_048020 [Parastagonospora nodorum]QRC92485.1 hypothetical protein JI435_305960 [Parastagonospora nodorum SN15]KAH3933392.1 hypothetical protein HBH54_075760 [Parastagonospora nodorum]KAH3938867.1 hypothetical protein HBH53_243830 [Parastagonospora nodorum]KAH3957326.1 hypothetical protein HBH51_227130 [Parastagonospora nodorum]
MSAGSIKRSNCKNHVHVLRHQSSLTDQRFNLVSIPQYLQPSSSISCPRTMPKLIPDYAHSFQSGYTFLEGCGGKRRIVATLRASDHFKHAHWHKKSLMMSRVMR